MNYLAHLYLSGESEPRLVGNFIGDFVKGKRYMDYPEEIKQGIILHRAIDTYADGHELVREAKAYFRPAYARYAAVVIDVVYDHFLAANWSKYSDFSLREFTKYAHAVLLSHYFKLPLRVQGMLPFLIQHKRLESYAELSGIKQTLEAMSRHSSLPNHAAEAIHVMEQNYDALNANFQQFFAQAIQEFMIKPRGY